LPIRAYRNNGQGVFADATAQVMPSSAVGRCWDVEVADVDKDGTLDLAIGGWGTQARLLLGTVKQPTPLFPKSGRHRADWGQGQPRLWITPAGRLLSRYGSPPRFLPAIPLALTPNP
jgi:hypothetical protein